jgi:molybdate transport system permease protein
MAGTTDVTANSMTSRAKNHPVLSMQARVGHHDSPRLNVDLTIDRPGVVGVIGPNGAGKSTLLRSIAGLEVLSASDHVAIDGVAVTDKAPSRRRVAYVPQSGALFPHLSVLDNVAYGLRAAGVRRGQARALAGRQLEQLGIADLRARSPRTLSGGQAQRVAIARALAVEPALILLDEPTASLDAAGRLEVRSVLRQHLAGFPGVTLLVTHDASEVLTLASRVVVLEGGEVVQDAASADLVRSPRSPWLAQMLRLNAWRGRVASNDAIALEEGGYLHAIELPPVGSDVLVTASPTAVTLFSDRPSSSARNVWRVSVDDVSVLGDRVRVFLSRKSDGPSHTVAEITPAAAADLGVAPGSVHFATLKATELSLSPL